jgi:hypothetical protein
LGKGRLAYLPKTVGAVQPVFIKGLRAENFGQFASPCAPEQVHLPQPVASGNETLGKNKVKFIGSCDIGNAASIPYNGNRCG